MTSKYSGHDTFESYRKELNARKLYEVMDKIGMPDSVQEAFVTGEYNVVEISAIVSSKGDSNEK